MAQYNFNVSQAPNGICPQKLRREIKAALGLAKKPSMPYVGTNVPGTDNLQSGTFTVICRNLSTDEQATLASVIASHVPCDPLITGDKPEYGFELDDLADLFETTMPGTTIYVRDLPRINGEGATNGTLVYRSRNGWRRVSNDQVVNP
jgi:hypothetical protein